MQDQTTSRLESEPVKAEHPVKAEPVVSEDPVKVESDPELDKETEKETHKADKTGEPKTPPQYSNGAGLSSVESGGPEPRTPIASQPRTPIASEGNFEGSLSGLLSVTSVPSTKSPEQVAEVTRTLKTRLSYAFMKTQKGWTMRSVSDLENTKLGRPFELSESMKPPKIDASRTKDTQSRPLESQDSRAKPHKRSTSDSEIDSKKKRKLTPSTSSTSDGKSHKRPLSIQLPDPSVVSSPQLVRTPSPDMEVDAAESLVYLSSPRASTSNSVFSKD